MRTLILMLISGFILSAFSQEKAVSLKGAWQWKNGNEVHTLIFSDQFYSVAEYNLVDKTFINTHGGSYRLNGKELILVPEFNASFTDDIGKERTRPVRVSASTLSVTFNDKIKKQEWNRIDSGEPGKLAGSWLITGRMVDNEMQKITPGARRTMKILSGTRFQWVAFNSETKEFFGTGGGTYETKDGKYTENIEFFSRDNSRVGKSLSFDFQLDDGKWRHKGFSSKGDPIDEVWTKRELLGI